MFPDLTARPLNPGAYSDAPFNFIDQDAQNDLVNITSINLIENGDRVARENWQNRRLTSLLRHVQARSAFWRKRLPSRPLNHTAMKYVPIQSRRDIVAQVDLEGSLMDGEASVMNYASTGSTGAPVKVFLCPENGYYNLLRTRAECFISDLSLDENLVFIVPPISMAKLEKKSLAVERSNNWVGPIAKVFRNGSARKIVHQYDDDALINELKKQPFGHLVCANRYVNVMLNHGGPGFVNSLGVKVWMHNADYRDPNNVAALKSVGIRCLSNYSSGETGPIAFECSKFEGHYHVAHSNVIVECDRQLEASFNEASLGRLLITHLHSYATPIIRYDIGDFGQVDQQCRCGHDGPTISNIFGRGKHFLKHPDGRLLPFYLSTRMLMRAVEFTECRFRQDKVDTITAEIGGRESITADEEANLRTLVTKATDPAFHIEIKTTRQIDWSANPKRLFFSSSVT